MTYSLRVACIGLPDRVELNGLRGRVMSFNEASGRYNVVLDGSGDTVAIKSTNLAELGVFAPTLC